MIHDFYHNTREEIKELEARISNFDTEMQNAEENQKTDTNSHMQKVKHLYYEHENSCNQVKAEAKNIMSAEHQNHGENEKLAQKNKQEKKDHYGQEEYANIAEIEDKEKQLQKDVADLKETLELQKAELIKNYDEKMVRLHKELLLRMKVEIHEIEERKN